MDHSIHAALTALALALALLASSTSAAAAEPICTGETVSDLASSTSAAAAEPISTGETVFDVTQYGALPNNKTDNAMAFIRAWKAACTSNGAAKLVIPKGDFVAGAVILRGPCTAQKPITVEIQGNLWAVPDVSEYPDGVWIMLTHIDGVVVNGGGSINGRGEVSWELDGGGNDGPHLPVSLIFGGVQNGAMHDLSFINSMGFHVKVTDSSNFVLRNLTISAPGKSPNTDGIHLSSAVNVNITDSVIGTGDDCISVGHGTENITISRINCGPGHGISIGSLGKRPTETNLKGVSITNCTLTGTTNGARIKTYHDSPEIEATQIVFEDLVMDQVKNPIIIDQHYDSKKKPTQSKVKISDVVYKNIRGTAISPVAVRLNCSSTVPCVGIVLADIDLQPFGTLAAGANLESVCANAKFNLTGTMNPAGPTQCS